MLGNDRAKRVARDRLRTDLIELPGSHSPFLSRPDTVWIRTITGPRQRVARPLAEDSVQSTDTQRSHAHVSNTARTAPTQLTQYLLIDNGFPNLANVRQQHQTLRLTD
jgi:hypothetical protein